MQFCSTKNKRHWDHTNYGNNIQILRTNWENWENRKLESISLISFQTVAIFCIIWSLNSSKISMSPCNYYGCHNPDLHSNVEGGKHMVWQSDRYWVVCLLPDLINEVLWMGSEKTYLSLTRGSRLTDKHLCLLFMPACIDLNEWMQRPLKPETSQDIS